MLGRGVEGDTTLPSSGLGMLMLVFERGFVELDELTDRKFVAMIFRVGWWVGAYIFDRSRPK